MRHGHEGLRFKFPKSAHVPARVLKIFPFIHDLGASICKRRHQRLDKGIKIDPAVARAKINAEAVWIHDERF